MINSLSVPVWILLANQIAAAHAYETSFAMKHFNFYERPVISRQPAGEVPRQQVEKLLNYLFESGSKSVGPETSESVIKTYLKSMSIPMGANRDISKWTLTQCRQAIKRIEEDFNGKHVIAKGLNVEQDMSFKKGLEKMIKVTRIGWAESANGNCCRF